MSLFRSDDHCGINRWPLCHQPMTTVASTDDHCGNDLRDGTKSFCLTKPAFIKKTFRCYFLSIEMKKVDVNFCCCWKLSQNLECKKRNRTTKQKCVVHLSAIHDFISKPPRCKVRMLEILARNITIILRKERLEKSHNWIRGYLPSFCLRKLSPYQFDKLVIHIMRRSSYFFKDPQHSQKIKLLMFVSLRSSSMCKLFPEGNRSFPENAAAFFATIHVFLFNKCFNKIFLKSFFKVYCTISLYWNKFIATYNIL